MKAAPSLAVVLIGAIGTIASLLALPDGTIKTILISIFSLTCLLGAAAALVPLLNVFANLSLLRSSKTLGIHRIFPHGHMAAEMKDAIPSARFVRIRAITSKEFLFHHKALIVSAIRQGAEIRVILAEPNSTFVKYQELLETEHRVGQISTEITNAISLLREFHSEAKRLANSDPVGRVKIVCHSGSFRSLLIILDEKHAWITFTLPPKRSIESPSLWCKAGPLLEMAVSHFDRTWNVLGGEGLPFIDLS